ncbi:OPT family oligopeptide transporter [Sorangium sp. So ce260]|uniref:OPT family oligopeptide transporter n=1 Tax=Sorangium sp. So ce260 TaxID=3133291 RepID=UPI003F5E54C7
MPLLQRPPETPEEMDRHRPLDLSPEEVSELDEQAWYERAYRGDEAPQLTLRAIVMGAALGFVLAFTNLYIGLKIGWHIGVAITACLLSFAIWGSFVRLGVARTPMTILENNCMQSTASAAGFSTGSTMVSAIPALLMLSASPERPGGEHLPWPVLAAWTFFLAVLGAVLAIPMKRNLINRERLRFPSGTAAAVTLQSLYGKGEGAAGKAKALLFAALASGVVPLLTSLNVARATDAAGKAARAALLPGVVKAFDWLPGIPGAGRTFPLSDWNIKLDCGPALIAAGALVGLRVTASMVLGGLVLVLFIGPWGMESMWINAAGAAVPAVTRPQAAWREIGLWAGAPMLVSVGLLSLAMQWRTIARAFTGLRGRGPALPPPRGEGARAPEGLAERVARTEVPGAWFWCGGLLASAGVVAIAWRAFEIPPHFGVLAVLLTFVLSLVACRATGESDVTPTGAMGKIMQLTYGVLIPQNATANLMTAGITSGAAAASADLMTDLKSGYLLGANPRRQLVAQLLGIVPGTIATVVGFHLLIPDASALTGGSGGEAPFPAPAAQQWRAVAQVFKLGVENLHPMARTCIAGGIVAGIVLVLAERALSGERLGAYRRYVPSATGVGLGLILPFYQPLSMFLGAAIAAIVGSRGGKAEAYVVPVASGLIAGESLVGVVVAALNNFVLR